jgi:hypothetical protein
VLQTNNQIHWYLLGIIKRTIATIGKKKRYDKELKSIIIKVTG